MRPDSSRVTLPPLICSCVQGQAACVALLLAHGSDADVAAGSGGSDYPLVLAARGGHLGCVKALAPLASQGQLRLAAKAAEEGKHAACLEVLQRFAEAGNGEPDAPASSLAGRC